LSDYFSLRVIGTVDGVAAKAAKATAIASLQGINEAQTSMYKCLTNTTNK